MTDTLPQQQPLWRRLRYTPLRDLLRGNLSARLDVRTRIASADLPDSVHTLITKVVKRTRLWRGERADVAAELIAHFRDGLAAGKSVDELVADFGPPRPAARLIRRAKLRARHVVFRISRRLVQLAAVTFALALLGWFVLYLRFVSARPTVTYNYLAEFNATQQAISADDRAWPFYRQAMRTLPVMPTIYKTSTWNEKVPVNWSALRPGDEHWPAVETYLDQNQPGLDLIRQASAKPCLGYHYGDPVDQLHTEFATFSSQHSQRSPTDSNPLTCTLRLPQVDDLNALAYVLRADAHRAADQGNAALTTANLIAHINLAIQTRDAGAFLVVDLNALRNFRIALETLQDILLTHPDLFSEVQLREISSHVASAFDGEFQPRLDGERAMHGDLFQRVFTDDGAGDGRITPYGAALLATWDRTWPGLNALANSVSDVRADDSAATVTYPTWYQRLSSEALASLLATQVGTRLENQSVDDEYFELAEQLAATPAWQRDPQVVEEYDDRLASTPLNRLKYLPAILFMGAISPYLDSIDRMEMHRDAALIALAAHLHHRTTGAWPESLADLPTGALPRTPLDRFDGQPLRYQLAGGEPLIYSIAADRDDDAGHVPADRLQRDGCLRWYSPAQLADPDADVPDGDWRLWPTPNDVVE